MNKGSLALEPRHLSSTIYIYMEVFREIGQIDKMLESTNKHVLIKWNQN